jgi:hypothetical protein
MRRLVLSLALGLLAAVPASGEFIAEETDFQCLEKGRKVPGKHFVVFHRNKRKLRKAVRIARRDRPGKRYPVGTIIQLFPFEAMVKRGGSFNPEGNGWEYFSLRITPEGATIGRRGGVEVRNIAGSCQGCHAAASGHDFICEGHGAAPLGFTEEQILALQFDARCPPAE